MTVLYFFLGALAHFLYARYVARKGDRRDTPLHVACRKGNVKSVKYLLSRGADPNVYNANEESPLLLGCASDDSSIVKMLLDKAARANKGGAGGAELPCSKLAEA